MPDVPVQRFGGKGVMAALLYPHFVARHTYMEPFFGAGGMFFQVPRQHWTEYLVNDIDKRIVNLFRVLRDTPDALLQACALTPYARDSFLETKEVSPEPLEDARRMFVSLTQSFNSLGLAWRPPVPGIAQNKMQVAHNKSLSLTTFAPLLRSTAIENMDAVDMLTRYANEHTFIYSDPPYVHTSRKETEAYQHEMDDAHHIRLAEAHHSAAKAGARICISGYPSELYEDLYFGWRTVDIEVDCKSTPLHVKGTSRPKRTERLWMNYPPEEEISCRSTQAYKPKNARERQLLKALR